MCQSPYGLHCFVAAASVDISFWIKLLGVVMLMRMLSVHSSALFVYIHISFYTHLVGTQAFGIILRVQKLSFHMASIATILDDIVGLVAGFIVS
jgi:hypothetical protein